MAMNPEVKAKWLAALRSGEYKQTQGVLNNGRGAFCCLGVLCDIHAKENGGKWQTTGRAGLEYISSYMLLPEAVQEWAGVPNCNPSVKAEVDEDVEAFENLAYLNDERCKSFAEIADLIEAHL